MSAALPPRTTTAHAAYEAYYLERGEPLPEEASLQSAFDGIDHGRPAGPSREP